MKLVQASVEWDNDGNKVIFQNCAPFINETNNT